MRPRKLLVVWAKRLDVAADLAWTLDIAGHFRAMAVDSGQDLEAELRRLGETCSLVVLITNGCDGGKALAVVSKSLAPHCPVLGISTRGVTELGEEFDRTIGTCDRFVVLETIRTATARKRGPRKGTPRSKPATAPEPEREPDGTREQHRVD